MALTAPASPIAAGGGVGEVALTTTPECAWTASAANWGARIDPSSGQGSATLRLDFPANASSLARQTDVVVNGVHIQVQQQAAPCGFELSSSDQVLGAAGGTVRVTVSTLDGCAWTASSSATWMTVTSHGSGQGTGVVELEVQPNAGGPRNGSVSVADQSYTIGQEAAAPTACTYNVIPPTQTVPAAGGPLSVTVTTGCAWAAVSQAPWITTAPPTGSGSGTIVLTIGPNAGAGRTGTVSVGSALITITQAAAVNCTFTLSSTTGSAPASGVTGLSVGVTGPATCTWATSSNASWITIPSRTASSGNGTVTLDVAANTGGARNGTVTLAGQTFTVSQAGGCIVTVNPLTAAVPVAGGSDQVSVTTGGGCQWTASSGSAWLTITAGASGAGNGTVRYAASANTGAARAGTLTVGGQTVSITQAGGCLYSVTPTTASVAATGGAGPTISVTAAAGCTWSASSGVSWITLTGGASGGGAGAVTYSVAANSGSARSGTLSVAGQTVSVSQNGGCSYVVAPTTASIPAGGGTGPSISVSAAAGCTWTATTTTPWLTIKSGATGSGGGTVIFTATANTGAARAGSLTIAGQTVSVDQPAPCAYAVTVAPLSFSNDGGTAIGTVVTTAGCAWTASSDKNWVTLTSAASQSGSATVSFRIDPNPGGSRSASVTVAGQTFTISEAKK